MPKTYSVKQVSQALGFSTNTVYKHLEDGTISATRFGNSGRFRIPESEVVRLLGNQNQVAPMAPPTPDLPLPLPEVNAPSPAPVSEQVDTARSLLNQVSTPDLFDWFLILSSFFLGLAYFLYPTTFQSSSIQPLLPHLLIAKSVLLISSIGLLILDVFLPVKKHAWRLVSRLPLIAALGLLTYIYLSTSEYLTASFILPLTIFSALSTFWFRSAFPRFLSFLSLFYISITIGFVVDPQPIFIFDPTVVISRYLPVILIGSLLLSVMVFALSWLSSRKLPQLLPLILWPQAILLLLLCVNFTASQAWNKATISLVLGSFTILLPFHQSLTSLSGLTRRQAITAICWLTCTTLIGTLLVYLTQNSFRSVILNQASQNLNSASQVIETFIDDSIRVLSVISSSTEIPLLVSQSDHPSPNAKLSQLIKEAFLASPSMRRVTITNSSGVPQVTYPLSNTSSSELALTSLSQEDYFTQAKSTGRTIVSQVNSPVITSLNPTIYVTIPLYDTAENFIGVVIGALDMSRLSQRLTDLKPSSKSYYIIADTHNRVVYHPDPSQMGQLIPPPSPITNAVAGQTGSSSSYTSDGSLSLQAYTHLSRLGWGISLIQPYSTSFRTPSLISFSIFLVTLICGAGAIVTVTQLRRVQT